MRQTWMDDPKADKADLRKGPLSTWWAQLVPYAVIAALVLTGIKAPQYLAVVVAAVFVVPFFLIKVHGLVTLLIRLPPPFGRLWRTQYEATVRDVGLHQANRKRRILRALYCRYQRRAMAQAVPHFMAVGILGAAAVAAPDHLVLSVVLAVVSVAITIIALVHFVRNSRTMRRIESRAASQGNATDQAG